MKKIGQVLSAKRKEKGLSIDDISSILKIKPQWIASLENDNYDGLIPPIYYQGFLKQYNKLLDIEYLFNEETTTTTEVQNFEKENCFIDKINLNFLVAAAAFILTVIIYLTSSNIVNKKGNDLLTQEFANRKTNFAKLQN